jgi:hypothetical protein
MAVGKKIVSLIDEGYEVLFGGDDICRGLRIRVRKSLFEVEEFITYETLTRSLVGSEFLIMETINRMVREVDKKMKGESE